MGISCLACGNSAGFSEHNKLIAAYAPIDDEGLRHFYVYCRNCHKFSEYIPAGCLAILMLQPSREPLGVVAMEKVIMDYGNLMSMTMSPNDKGSFDNIAISHWFLIQSAMNEDGFNPETLEFED